MRRAVALLSVLVLAGCGSRVAATSPSATPKPRVELTTVPAAPAAGGAGKQDAVLGPAGMTLQQEIGAVMMVGFTGPLTPAEIGRASCRERGDVMGRSAIPEERRRRTTGRPSQSCTI